MLLCIVKCISMTFKDLKKRLSNSQSLELQQSKIFDRLCNKPFWMGYTRA